MNYPIFNGGYLTVPGTGPRSEVNERAVGLFWGRPEELGRISEVLDGDSLDAGNTGYTSSLRSGLLMARYSSGAKVNQVAPWNPTGANGLNRIYGVLEMPVSVGASASDKFGAVVVVSGKVKAKGIIVPGSTNRGFDGTAYEYLIRQQMVGRFLFDDDPHNAQVGASLSQEVTAITANAVLTQADMGKLIAVAGAGATTVTLPTASTVPFGQVEIVNTVNQNLIINCATNDTLVVYNDVAADSVALQTAGELIGGSFRCISNGTVWLILPRLWEGQTMTIVS